MSLAELIKESVMEYGPALIPFGLGLKAYYDSARANILYFQKNPWGAKMSGILAELARLYGPLTIIDIASEHFTKFEKITWHQYGLAAFLYFFLTITQLLVLNGLKRRKKEGGKEETKTLDKIIAQHATPAKQ